MTPEEFDRRVAALGLTSKALPAARAVLCENRSINGAARDFSVDPALVFRHVKTISNAVLCPHCEQVINQKSDAAS